MGLFIPAQQMKSEGKPADLVLMKISVAMPTVVYDKDATLQACISHLQAPLLCITLAPASGQR